MPAAQQFYLRDPGAALELQYRPTGGLGSSQVSVHTNIGVSHTGHLHRAINILRWWAQIFLPPSERFLYFTQECWSPAEALIRNSQRQTLQLSSFQSKLRVSYFSSSFTFQASSGSSPQISKMEPLTTTYPLKHSVPKAKVFVVFLSMILCTAILCLLQLRFFKPKIRDFYSFEVMDSRGRIISLEKYRGKVSYNFIISLSWIFTEKQVSFWR